MTTAVLYHADNTRDSFFYGRGEIYTAADALRAYWAGEYGQVAVFDVSNDTAGLNEVYRNSQNIDDAWREPACRSTSVGDIIELGEVMYIVAGMGFDKLEAK